jgi:hypothetical protein
MLKIWLLYNLLLTALIFGTSISSAHSLTNYLLPLLLLPLFYYLGKELLRKPKHKKLAGPEVFASEVQGPARTVLAGQVEEGVPLDPTISDDNRRLFLKLVGSTSLSIFFMAIMGKGSAKAAFFGSMPGPGTVAIKDSSGTPIDPAILQPTDGFEISQVDDSVTPSYYGFVHKTGAWYITKEDATGAYRYAKGASDFATSWTGRTSLSYDYFDAVF